MKQITYIFCALIIATACSKIEPIEIIAPEREINTEQLKKQKENLEGKQVTFGAIYDWGKADKNALMHTPDELDIIIIKDSLGELTEQQKNDLDYVKEKKATKVLLSIDLKSPFEKNVERITAKVSLEIDDIINKKNEEFKNVILPQKTAEIEKKVRDENQDKNPYLGQRLIRNQINKVEREFKESIEEMKITLSDSISKKYASETNIDIDIQPAIKLMKSYFDGICVELPETGIAMFSKIKDLIKDITVEAGKSKGTILIFENPTTELSEEMKEANWVIKKMGENDTPLLENISASALKFPDLSFVPCVDFTREDLKKGFPDSEIFTPEGHYPMPIELALWNTPNKGGVAFWHIEKNYNDISGTLTYKMLREAIYHTHQNNK